MSVFRIIFIYLYTLQKKQGLLKKVVISCILLLLLLHSFVRYVIYDDL